MLDIADASNSTSLVRVSWIPSAVVIAEPKASIPFEVFSADFRRVSNPLSNKVVFSFNALNTGTAIATAALRGPRAPRARPPTF